MSHLKFSILKPNLFYYSDLNDLENQQTSRSVHSFANNAMIQEIEKLE